MKELLKLPEDSLWQLKRVLPGQRNGAQRWFQDFLHHLQALGFTSCTAMPSVLRHQTKKLAINIHVDDELVVGETVEDIERVIDALKKIYKLQVEGPMPKEPLGNGEELNYLKKTYVFQEDGIYVRPNSKFTETLIKLYGLQDRKEKQVPEHCLLGHPGTSPELDKKRQADFRTGLGTGDSASGRRFCVVRLGCSGWFFVWFGVCLCSFPHHHFAFPFPSMMTWALRPHGVRTRGKKCVGCRCRLFCHDFVL